MKFKFSALILLSVLFFTQCEKTEVDKNSITVNDEEFSIQNATITDYGPNQDLTYRYYSLKFTSGDTDPKTYFYFDIKSNSTSRLEEGIYQYDYSFQAGTIKYPELGYNLAYDDKGYVIEGTMISGSSDDSGSITISQDDNYIFEIDLIMHKNGTAYNVKGHINLPLTEY